MFRASLFAAILFAVLPLSSQATSRSRQASRPSAAAERPGYTCETRAKFLRAVFKNEKVYWQFSVESNRPAGAGECPSSTETLDVLVWGGQYVASRGGAFVYPEYIAEPAPDSRNVLQLERRVVREARSRREYRDWTVTDWEKGIRQLP